MMAAKMYRGCHIYTQKEIPEMLPHLRDFYLCLLTLALCVKPLANVVADYACCDGQQKCTEISHSYTSSLLPDWSRAAETVYHIFLSFSIKNPLLLQQERACHISFCFDLEGSFG